MKQTKKPDVYERVTNRIISLLEEGTLPWESTSIAQVGFPRNFQTQNYYRGINVFLLGSIGASSPWFLTYNQAQELGGQVRRGEKGWPIIKYGTFLEKTDSENDEEKKRGYLRGYTVFHESQIDGIDFPEPQPHPEYTQSQKRDLVERVVHEMPNPPVIREGFRAIPAYFQKVDRVDMPDRKTFSHEDFYFKTLFHELSHSTGHKSRLARKSLLDNVGIQAAENESKKTYCFEELVAEMSAAYLTATVGILEKESDPESASYIQGWLQALKVKDNSKWVVQAASQAQKASDYILGKMGEAHV